jgi:transketolase
LGQGFANGVGMAIAARRTSARSSTKRILKSSITYVYAIVSDGDLMEGVAAEAAITRRTSQARQADLSVRRQQRHDRRLHQSRVQRRRAETFRSVRLAHVDVLDGNNLDDIEAAIREAQNSHDRPSLILSQDGHRLRNADAGHTQSAQRRSPAKTRFRETKRHLAGRRQAVFTFRKRRWPHFRKADRRGEQLESEWRELVRIREKHPEDGKVAADDERRASGGWEEHLPKFEDAKAVATRVASGEVINALAPVMPMLIGGSAISAYRTTPTSRAATVSRRARTTDAFFISACANMRWVDDDGHFAERRFDSVWRDVSDVSRLHAAGDRLAALSEVQVIYVFTHDSVGSAKMANAPADRTSRGVACDPASVCDSSGGFAEVSEAWRIAILRRNAPTALALTRQKVRSSIVKIRGGGGFAARRVHSRGSCERRRRGDSPKLILIGPARKSRWRSKRARSYRRKACRRASSRCRVGNC